MKLLIEINTNDRTTLEDAHFLIESYLDSMDTTEVKPRPEPKPKPEPKPEPEPEPETEETTQPEPADDDSVTLTDLKKAAKEASGKVGREEVVGAIKRYSPSGKLADVTENNYQALFNDLQKL